MGAYSLDALECARRDKNATAPLKGVGPLQSCTCERTSSHFLTTSGGKFNLLCHISTRWHFYDLELQSYLFLELGITFKFWHFL